MAVNDLFRVTVQGTVYGQTCVSVLHYIETVTGSGSANVVLSQAADAALGQGFRDYISSSATYDQTSAQRMLPAPPSFSIVTNTNTGVGAVASAPAPTTVSAVLTKQTVNAGPSWRGRVFLWGVPQSYITDSALNGTGATAGATLGAILLAPLVNSGYTFTPVLWRKTAGNAMPVASFQPRVTLRVQRRREIGVGE